MARYDNTKRNQYNSTPRKVFDAYIDKMALRRSQDKEDHRADLHALLQRIRNLEDQLSQLHEHVQSHCHVLNDEDQLEGDTPLRKGGNEGLG